MKSELIGPCSNKGIQSQYLTLFPGDKIDSKKVTDSDGMEAWLFKRQGLTLASPLCQILNQCSLEGCFPTSWKIAAIKPLPKTSAAIHAKKHHEHQYTRQSNRSMIDALAQIIDRASFSSEKGMTVKIVIIEVSKNCVNHQTLIHELRSLGFCTTLLPIYHCRLPAKSPYTN